MKRLTAIILLVTLLLCGCAQTLYINESTIVTRTGTVTDRAMATPNGSSKSYPYVGILFEDGTGVCVFAKYGFAEIPDGLQCGDTVEVTCGQENGYGHEWILLGIKKVS